MVGGDGDDRIFGSDGNNDIGDDGNGADVCHPTTEIRISC
jgi:hypothetical protein